MASHKRFKEKSEKYRKRNGEKRVGSKIGEPESDHHLSGDRKNVGDSLKTIKIRK